MSVITLTTEFSRNDYYIGAIKGALSANIPGCTIVDLAHDIPKKNIAQAAFIIKSCYRAFPDNTIHIICVDSEATDQNSHLIIKNNSHYFVCSDNGIPGLLFDNEPEMIIKLDTAEFQTTFPELYVFVGSAIQISKGEDITKQGVETKTLNKFRSFIPFVEKDKNDGVVLTGSIIYIDSFGNAITNISKKQFDELATGKQFSIYPQSTHHRINKINKTYHETEDGEILAIFNHLSLLEIAQKNGSADSMLKLNINDNIRIQFK